MKNIMENLTPPQRKTFTEAARKARKEACKPEDQIKQAKTREANQTGATEESIKIAKLLSTFNPILEFSIDRFNVDIALLSMKVAIELDGGNWHSSGQIRSRDMAKESILRNQGWIIIRIRNSTEISYIISCLDRISSPPL